MYTKELRWPHRWQAAPIALVVLSMIAALAFVAASFAYSVVEAVEESKREGNIAVRPGKYFPCTDLDHSDFRSKINRSLQRSIDHFSGNLGIWIVIFDLRNDHDTDQSYIFKAIIVLNEELILSDL